ncbi:MAG: DUF364 domain-containing protein [Actinobacteria bacterium]|nr:DUF364 domain-containing protein [Actinomycetota bacterium]
MESDDTLPVIEGIKSEATGSGGGTVSEVIVGLGFSMVYLEESCGLAYTLRDNLKTGCEAFDEAGRLAGKDAGELFSWIGGSSPIASALGLAAANAVLNPPRGCLEENLFDALSLQPEEKVVTIGRFKPMEPELARFGVRLEVVEWGESPEPLSRCDVALITATSIINNTIDTLLETVRNAREVVILGPSTPYTPAAFTGTPVTRLAGSIVSDPGRARQVVCEGGGTRTLGKALSRWVATV